jgi:O-antigen ligase
VLAVAYQIQVTLPVSPAGLRVCAADFVVPVLFAALAMNNLRGQIPFPTWRLPRLWTWLAVLSVWLAITLIIGYLRTGEWIAWAVVNKFAGWFVLLGNFIVAGQIAAADRSGRLRETFLKVSFVSAWIIAAAAMALFALFRIGIWVVPPGSDAAWRLEGLFVNANAYGYFVVVMIAFQAPYLARRTLLPLRLHRIGLVIGLVALILAASRSAWIGAALALPVLYHCDSLDLRETCRAAALAAVLSIIIYLLPTHVALIRGDLGASDFGTPMQQIYLTQERGADIATRLRVMLEAFSAWRAHPIEGIGLGGFLWQCVAARDNPLILIHSSAQWLLTETGIVGLVLFLAFFTKIVQALLVPCIREGDNLFRIAMLAALAVFVGASIGMEAIYQRHLWFLLGWALAAPIGQGSAGKAGTVRG